MVIYMNDTVIILVLIMLIVIISFVLVYLRRRKDESFCSDGAIKSDRQQENYFPIFSFETLPDTTQIDEKKLIEIKDKQLLATIDNVIPNAGVSVQNVKAAQGLKNAEELYRVIIPQRANLDHSKAMENAFRATFRDVPNSYQGQANLLKADGAALASQGANVANAVMNVGSMVVGQYYMSEINNKLEDITDNIKEINDF